MSDAKWRDNAIQFPRLIAELEAVGAFTPEVYAWLEEAMDLDQPQIAELVERAQTEWDRIKSIPAGATTCPNCSDPIKGHIGGYCMVSALGGVVRDRDELEVEEIEALMARIDADKLWDDLGPVIDAFEQGEYSEEDRDPPTGQPETESSNQTKGQA